MIRLDPANRDYNPQRYRPDQCPRRAASPDCSANIEPRRRPACVPAGAASRKARPDEPRSILGQEFDPGDLAVAIAVEFLERRKVGLPAEEAEQAPRRGIFLGVEVSS